MRLTTNVQGAGRRERPAVLAVSILALIVAAPASPPEGAPRLADIDRVRLAEAFRLSDEIGDRL